MSPAKRIFLNVAATYGRSLYALAVGLFCGRWALMSLGEVDFGLFGLVGGLTAFVVFFNGLFASAVGRFYAYSVGREKLAEGKANDECRKWFNTAFTLHAALSVSLVGVGYPLGAWAVGHFLAIPPDRAGACLWVWRFSCLSCFASMALVPFRAMYTAKQEIAEMTVYEVMSTTLKAAVLGYMVTHPGDWLAAYAFAMMAVAVLPQLIIAARALSRYGECRFVRAYLWSPERTRELAVYAFARFWSSLSSVVASQGMSIAVNKYLGAAYNASMSVGNQVVGMASTLGGALAGAFWPAIGNKAGEGREDDVRRLSFMTCRLGALLVLVFALPLALEVDEVLRIWLKEPPPSASVVCLAIMFCMVLERVSEGYWMAILAVGRRVGFYSMCVSVPGFAGLGVACAALALGMGIKGVCAGMAAGGTILVAMRVALGRYLVAMSATHWLRHVLAPVAAVSAATLAAGYVPHLVMGQCFLRVVVTTLVCESVFLPLSWFLVLSPEERSAVERKIKDRGQRMVRTEDKRQKTEDGATMRRGWCGRSDF